MSEFTESHEQYLVPSQIEHAAKYLRSRLEAAGSFEHLIISLQNDYTGERITTEPQPETGEYFIGNGAQTPRVGGELYEDSVGAGQVYQLLRVADSIANPEGTEQHNTHAFYAGELLAMTVVDYATENNNSIPASILGLLGRLREDKWKNLPNSFPTTEQHNQANKEISREIRQSIYDFSVVARNDFQEIKELFDELTQTLPTEVLSYIEGGFWLIIQEWQQPDTLTLAQETAQTQPIAEPIKAAPSFDDILAEFERDFNDIEVDFDITEWNRDSLNTMAYDIITKAVQIRIDAASQSLGDPESPEVASLLRKRLKHELNRYIDMEYGLDKDDLVYAHGTFVGIANSKLPLADYDESGVLQDTDRQFAYQAISPIDYRNLLANPDADIVPYEVRGSFDKIIITKAVSDVDSYTVDINDVNSHDRLTYDSYVPAVRILNASIIDMRRNLPVEHLNDIVIPLTHTHLELGRFVPPASDDD